MFVGENYVKLDSKGRVLFPSSLKHQMPVSEHSSCFVLKKDIYSECLLLYPKTIWDNFTNNLRLKLNPFDKSHSVFLREFYRGTADITLDSSGRLLIPKRMLDLIRAGKDLVFAGQIDLIQIWVPDIYEASKISDSDLAQLTEKLFSGNINFY